MQITAIIEEGTVSAGALKKPASSKLPRLLLTPRTNEHAGVSEPLSPETSFFQANLELHPHFVLHFDCSPTHTYRGDTEVGLL
jgi:hypothetical protein